MGTSKVKKLTLQRETIRVLTADELVDVDGGTSASVFRVAYQASKKYCWKAGKFVTVNVCIPVSIELCTKVVTGGISLPKEKPPQPIEE